MANWFTRFFAAKPEVAPTPGEPDTRIVSVERSTFGSFGNMPRYNPDELVRKKGLSIFAKMRLDEQIKAVCTFKRDSILSRGWTFEFDKDSKLGEKEKEQRIRVFEQIIQRMPGSFVDALNVISTGREYGYSLTEKVYDAIDVDGKAYTGLRALLGRDPQSFEFITDEYGELVKCQQVIGGRRIDIDLDKFIHYVHNPEFDRYFGQSELREAYRSWFMKDVLIKHWAMYMEKLGGGMVIANISTEANIRAGSKEYTALQQILMNMKASAGIIMPSGVTAEVVFPTNSDAFERACQYHDAAIAKSLLIPGIATGVGASDQKSGTAAQGQTQLEAFAWMIKADTARLEACIDEQLFRDLGAQNWGDEEYPHFTFKPMNTEQLRYIVTTWSALCQQGAVIPTEDDEKRLREILEMPPRDDSSKTLMEVKQELMPTPPPGAPGVPGAPPPTAEAKAPPPGGKPPAKAEEKPKKEEMSHVVNVHGGITAEQLSRIIERNNEQLLEAFGYNPDQERDEDGKFSGGGMSPKLQDIVDREHDYLQNGAGRKDATIEDALEHIISLPTGSANITKGVQNEARRVLRQLRKENDKSRGLSEQGKQAIKDLKKREQMSRPHLRIVAHTPTGEPRVATKQAFTRALLRVEFSVLEAKMENGAYTDAQAISKLVAKAVKRVLDPEALPTLLDNDVQDIADLRIDGTDVGNIKRAMKSSLQKAWELGQNHARKEMSRAGKPIAFAALRDNATDYFDANGFRMAGNLTDAMKGIIQAELLQAVKKGTRPEEVSATIYERLIRKGMTTLDAVKEEVGGDIADQVEDALEDVLNTANVPAYLNTLVRTNTFEALNEARYAEFTDPALSDFILALEYSAVLDDVTTEICRHMDGRIYAADSDIWNDYRPPNHYNCRSVLVPVTAVDGWDGVESPEPKLEPAVGFSAATAQQRFVFEWNEEDHPRDEDGRFGDGGGGKTKLPKAAHTELIAAEADTLDENSPEGKKELVKQLRAGKEVSGKGLEYLKQQLPYHIDKLKDEVENGDKSFRPALNAMRKLHAELSGKKFAYDPDQERDESGRWTDGGGISKEDADRYNAHASKGKNASVSHYKTEGYKAINEGLRRGKAMSAADKAAVNGLDKLIDNSPLPHDVTMYRGVSGEFAQRVASMKEGSDFVDHGYTSWSVDSGKAGEFSSDVVLKLNAKKGWKAAPLDGHSKLLEGREYEYLAQRGNVFIVDKITRVGGKTVVEVSHEDPSVIAKPKKFARLARTDTLYVCRPVENAEDIAKWAKSQGFDTTLRPEDMHVTIAYSKRPVDWGSFPESKDELRVAPSLADRSVQYLGDKGAIVLKFRSPELTMRWSDFVDGGASWDFDGYRPHITITYNNENAIDPKVVMPYTGEIVLGPEIWDSVDEDWNEKIVEMAFDPDQPRDENGRWGESLSVSSDGQELTLTVAGKKVGEASLRLDKANDLVEVRTVGVLESEQGKGYGGRLLRAAIEEAQRRYPDKPTYVGTTEPKLRGILERMGAANHPEADGLMVLPPRNGK